MTISSTPITPKAIASIRNDAELLPALKELKNSIIGNTWKKVEVADEEGLLKFLLDRANIRNNETTQSEIAAEIAVIIASVASEGSLTVRQLLEAKAPEQLLELIRRSSQGSSTDNTTFITSALRALRNVLMSTADMAWGNMWGVGRERRVVGTGLVGPGGDDRDLEPSSIMDRPVESSIDRREGTRVLGLVFQPANLYALLSLLDFATSPQIATPLYQIFARLTSRPNHRRFLTSWKPFKNRPKPLGRHGVLGPSTYILDHIKVVIEQKPNAKMLEAALDLLAAIVKDEGALASDFCFCSKDDSDLAALRSKHPTIGQISSASAALHDNNVKLLLPLLEAGQTPVRIAAAACLVNIYRAKPRSAKFELIANIPKAVIPNIGILLDTESIEERTKLCFILATLMSDDTALQKLGATLKYPEIVMDVLHQIEDACANGRLDQDTAARGREAAFLALAGLSSKLESTRCVIADSSRPFLEYLRQALGDPSFGVRAAACQLVRALSRTVSLVRTSLMDSGVTSAVVSLFSNYTPSRVEEVARNNRADEWIDGGERWQDKEFVIELAAMAALGNLVGDFIPLKEMMMGRSVLQCIRNFANYPSETMVVGALWDFKSLMYKSPERDKATIIDTIGVRVLMKLTLPSAPTRVNIQALGIIQNYLADGTLADLSNAVDKLGEDRLLGAIQTGLYDGQTELRVAALRVLVNLCWGNVLLRQMVVRNDSIVFSLVDSLDSPYDEIKFCALKAIRNLVASTSKSERPRMATLAPFAPYNIGPKVKALAESSPSLDVSTIAVALNAVLDKVKPGSSDFVEDPLDR